MIASEDALDQFFVNEPAALLERTAEAALIDHATPRILDGHVRSAAYEGPLTDADAEVLGPEALQRAAVRARVDARGLRVARPGHARRAPVAPLR